jgi:hypothetical protein
MCFEWLASTDSGSLVSTLYASGVMKSHMFSMCLTFDGGAFVLGGVESRMHKSPIQWTPLTSSRGFYTVVLSSALVNDNRVSVRAYVAWLLA